MCQCSPQHSHVTFNRFHFINHHRRLHVNALLIFAAYETLTQTLTRNNNDNLRKLK